MKGPLKDSRNYVVKVLPKLYRPTQIFFCILCTESCSGLDGGKGSIETVLLLGYFLILDRLGSE